jgi:hemerythrin-like domain-containing protein
MKPTDTLKHEHQIILLVLSAAECEAQKGEGTGLDLARVTQMADFFRNFADKCHHAKEEDQLFPRLVERGLPQEEGPIAVMLVEHNEGRAHVRGIFAELEKPAGDQMVIARHLGGFVELLRGHIGKEDNVLFPLADQLLTAADQVELTDAFERVETEEIGEGVHEKYHQLAHELAEH